MFCIHGIHITKVAVSAKIDQQLFMASFGHFEQRQCQIEVGLAVKFGVCCQLVSNVGKTGGECVDHYGGLRGLDAAGDSQHQGI